jgi:hypothetical protein
MHAISDAQVSSAYTWTVEDLQHNSKKSTLRGGNAKDERFLKKSD